MTETMYETLMFAVLVTIDMMPYAGGTTLTFPTKSGGKLLVKPFQTAVEILACYWLWRVCT